MTQIIIVEKENFKQETIDDINNLFKKCKFKKQEDFLELKTWNYKSFELKLFGKVKGKSHTKYFYKFPNFEKNLYGNIAVVCFCKKKYFDLDLNLWKNFLNNYEKNNEELEFENKNQEEINEKLEEEINEKLEEEINEKLEEEIDEKLDEEIDEKLEEENDEKLENENKDELSEEEDLEEDNDNEELEELPKEDIYKFNLEINEDIKYYSGSELTEDNYYYTSEDD